MRPRGGIIGASVTPTTSAASGVWTLREAEAYTRSVTWPTPFSPTSITGLQLWLDGADTATMYDATSGGSLVASGGGVARWNDKSGNGNHATQSTSSYRPTRAASGIAFNGSTQYLTIPQTNFQFGTNAFSAFAVVKVSSLASNTAVLCSQDNSGSTATIFRLLVLSTGYEYFTVRTQLTAATDTITPNTVTAGAYALTEASRSSNTFSARLNSGTAGTMSLTGSVNLSVPLSIGANTTDSSWYLNGAIGEILIYSSVSAMSSTTRDAIAQYLNTKWGIA